VGGDLFLLGGGAYSLGGSGEVRPEEVLAVSLRWLRRQASRLGIAIGDGLAPRRRPRCSRVLCMGVVDGTEVASRGDCFRGSGGLHRQNRSG
jgi:hypothetical protein